MSTMALADVGSKIAREMSLLADSVTVWTKGVVRTFKGKRKQIRSIPFSCSIPINLDKRSTEDWLDWLENNRASNEPEALAPGVAR